MYYRRPNEIIPPNNIKSITIPSTFNIPSLYQLKCLESVKIYIAGNREPFQEIFSQYFPSSLVKLFLYHYEHPINVNTLPKSIRQLTLNYHNLKSNHSVPVQANSLPNSLSILNIQRNSESVKIPIDFNYIPNGLTSLDLLSNEDDFYNIGSKDLSFLKSLSSLKIKCQQLDNSTTLPNNLVELVIHTPVIKKDFKFQQSLNIVLQSLELILTRFENINCSGSFSLNQKMVPRNLKSFVTNCPIRYIESNSSSSGEGSDESISTDIDKGGGFSSSNHLKSILPNTLTSLTLKVQSSLEVIDSIAPHIDILSTSLTYLDFDNYPSPLLFQDTLPSTLLYINFGNLFNQTIQVNVLPVHLKTLVLGKSYDKEFIRGSIPFGLEFLDIQNNSYSHQINLDNPYTVVQCFNYHKQSSFESDPHQLKVFKIPYTFTGQFQELGLHNKFNLEYLDLSHYHQELPVDKFSSSSIKTLIIGHSYFKSIINLNQFQSLETIIVKNGSPNIIINNNNNSNNSNSNNTINTYKLNKIIASHKNIQFLDILNESLYKYLHLTK